VHESQEQIVEMNNGCVCCTIRGDLARALMQLHEQRDEGRIAFDRVVIETTGMADPGPVTQTFFIDEDVGRRYRVDGVVTVVDARHGHATLDRQPEAQGQVGFADRILLSKTDLVDTAEEQSLRERLVRMNPRAPIRNAVMGQVPVGEIFGIGGFNLDAALEIDPDFLAGAGGADHGHEHHGHDHGHEHAHHHEDGESCEACAHENHEHWHPRHDDAIQAFVFQSERPFDAERLEETLGALIQVYGPDMLRYKGVLFVRGSGRRMVLQGVHMLMGVERGRSWERHETPVSRMVFIGRKLPKEIFVQGLESCLIR